MARIKKTFWVVTKRPAKRAAADFTPKIGVVLWGNADALAFRTVYDPSNDTKAHISSSTVHTVRLKDCAVFESERDAQEFQRCSLVIATLDRYEAAGEYARRFRTLHKEDVWIPSFSQAKRRASFENRISQLNALSMKNFSHSLFW